ncbi:MAG: biopolymer transporter ExbD [Planctomycetota bacterium]
MKIPDQSQRPFVGANMTPMIDVVFLLIIFFLVSSHLAKQETRFPVDLPVAATHNPIDLDSVSLTVTINQDRQILIAGKPVDLEQASNAFRELVSEKGLDASLRIRTDATVDYATVEPVLRKAADVGLLDIKIAVKEGGSR